MKNNISEDFIGEASDQLGQVIKDNIRKSQESRGTSLLTESDYFGLAEETMKDFLGQKLVEQKTYYDKKVNKLLKVIEGLKPLKKVAAFPNDWHKDIKLITIELYIIKVMSENKDYHCNVCKSFRALGKITEIENLYQRLNIPKEKYKVIIVEVDSADRVLNQRRDKNYTMRLSARGENWYMAKGFDIRGYPTIDITTEFIQGKSGAARRRPLWTRKEGLGRKVKGRIVWGRFTEFILDYFEDFDEKHLDNIPSRKLGYLHDVEREKRKRKTK